MEHESLMLIFVKAVVWYTKNVHKSFYKADGLID